MSTTRQFPGTAHFFTAPGAIPHKRHQRTAATLPLTLSLYIVCQDICGCFLQRTPAHNTRHNNPSHSLRHAHSAGSLMAYETRSHGRDYRTRTRGSIACSLQPALRICDTHARSAMFFCIFAETRATACGARTSQLLPFCVLATPAVRFCLRT